MKIFINLFYKLEEMGKTPYWLTQNSKLDKNTVYKLCKSSNKMIDLETFEYLCNLLNCNLDELLILIDDKSYEKNVTDINNKINQNTRNKISRK